MVVAQPARHRHRAALHGGHDPPAGRGRAAGLAAAHRCSVPGHLRSTGEEGLRTGHRGGDRTVLQPALRRGLPAAQADPAHPARPSLGRVERSRDDPGDEPPGARGRTHPVLGGDLRRRGGPALRGDLGPQPGAGGLERGRRGRELGRLSSALRRRGVGLVPARPRHVGLPQALPLALRARRDRSLGGAPRHDLGRLPEGVRQVGPEGLLPDLRPGRRQRFGDPLCGAVREARGPAAAAVPRRGPDRERRDRLGDSPGDEGLAGVERFARGRPRQEAGVRARLLLGEPDWPVCQPTSRGSASPASRRR